MNKLVAGAVAGLVLGCLSAASALDMSAGGGGFFASDFGGQGTTYKVNDKENTGRSPWLGGGVHLFFDVTYAEIGVDLLFGGGTSQSVVNGEKVEIKDETKTTRSFTGLGISLLGKYPFALSDAMSLFPAVGIDYQLCLAGESKTGKGDAVKWEKKKVGDVEIGNDPIDYSQLWIKFGAGLDYAFTDKIFLRPELLYGIGFASKVTNDGIDATKKANEAIPEASRPDDPKAILSHGLTVKVGVGFKF